MATMPTTVPEPTPITPVSLPRTNSGFSAWFPVGGSHRLDMNIRASILVIGGALLFVGCKREAAVPGESFRISVQSILTEGDLKVSLIKYHLPRGASFIVHTEYSQGYTTMQDAPIPGEVGQRDGQVILSASRVARVGDAFASIQTLTRLETDHGSFGGPYVSYVPAATNLDAYFSVTATPGDYKLDTPIEIGRLDGKPVTLLVSRHIKLNIRPNAAPPTLATAP